MCDMRWYFNSHNAAPRHPLETHFIVDAGPHYLLMVSFFPLDLLSRKGIMSPVRVAIFHRIAFVSQLVHFFVMRYYLFIEKSLGGIVQECIEPGLCSFRSNYIVCPYFGTTIHHSHPLLPRPSLAAPYKFASATRSRASALCPEAPEIIPLY